MESILLLTVFLFSLVFAISYKRISKIVNIYDSPNINRKKHLKPTPVIGGIFIYFVLMFYLSVCFFDNLILYSNPFIETKKDLIIFFLGSTVLFLTGLFDDKYESSTNVRAFIIFFSSLVIVHLDQSLIIDEIVFKTINFSIKLGNSKFIFTALCIFVLIFSLNMFDGVNLQSGIYYLIVFSYLLLINNSNYLFLITILISIITFMYLNKNGSIFLGDSGVYLMAFILSCLLIDNYNVQSISVEEILVLLFLPIIDSLRLFFFRTFKAATPVFFLLKLTKHVV